VGCTNNAKKEGVCWRHRSKNINATKNNDVTPVIASRRSADYEEEEELNSWIWRSNARPSQNTMKSNLQECSKKQQDDSAGSQMPPVSSKTKAKKATKTFAINNTPTTPILEAATGSSRLSSSGKTTGLSHQDMTEKNVFSEQDVTLCIMCEDAKKEVLLFPCRHLCLCKVCASTCLFKTLHECPMCRKTIVDSMEVYW
jgi:hypothetical protein